MRARFAVSVFAVVAWAAQACVPQPNAQGAVTCGAGDICPAGFVCSFGHCCPSDASVSQRPQAQYVEPSHNGSLPCNARGECPMAHGFTCRMGLACCAEGDGGTGQCSPGAPGAACTAGSSCDSFTGTGEAARCITEVSPVIAGTLGDAIRIPVPNGICSAPCDPSNIRSCGASAYCMGALRVPGQPRGSAGSARRAASFPRGNPMLRAAPIARPSARSRSTRASRSRKEAVRPRAFAFPTARATTTARGFRRRSSPCAATPPRTCASAAHRWFAADDEARQNAQRWPRRSWAMRSAITCDEIPSRSARSRTV